MGGWGGWGSRKLSRLCSGMPPSLFWDGEGPGGEGDREGCAVNHSRSPPLNQEQKLLVFLKGGNFNKLYLNGLSKFNETDHKRGNLNN